METEEIKITIAQKSYKLNIDPSKRELYRLAERKVNASITRYERQNFEGFSAKDAIALTAFEYAVANITLKQNSELASDDMAQLQELEQRIESYLNDLSIEKKR